MATVSIVGVSASNANNDNQFAPHYYSETSIDATGCENTTTGLISLQTSGRSLCYLYDAFGILPNAAWFSSQIT